MVSVPIIALYQVYGKDIVIENKDLDEFICDFCEKKIEEGEEFYVLFNNVYDYENINPWGVCCVLCLSVLSKETEIIKVSAWR
jgi:hypothetical protein